MKRPTYATVCHLFNGGCPRQAPGQPTRWCYGCRGLHAERIVAWKKRKRAAQPGAGARASGGPDGGGRKEES